MGKASRLVEATLDAWCEQSSGELSARSIAARIGSNASGIYYHFDDLEHLYESSQAAALALAEQWCAVHVAGLDGSAGVSEMPGEALGPLLAMLIDDLCEGHRRIAFAWRQCQLMAARGPRFAPLRDRWTALWRGFWEDVCGRFGLQEQAWLTALFFDGESYLHLMRWSRVADRACLEEMTTGWSAWLTGRTGVAAPWRAHARAQARRAELGLLPEGTQRQVAAAAAGLLAHGGAGSVSHRTVAAASGLTLGMVSHQCRRTDDLLRVAFSEIYWRLTGAPLTGPDPSEPLPAVPGSQHGGQSQLLAIDELILAVARGQAEAELAPRLRYLRGSTSRRTVMEQLGPDVGEAVLEGAIYSSVMMALGRATFHRTEEEAMADYLEMSALLFAPLKASGPR